MCEARLDQASLALVADESGHGLAELLPSRGGILLLDDPGPCPDHLGKRPIGDALAVAQTSALVPVAAFLDPVEVLEVLPHEPRFTRACFAHDRDVLGAALARAQLRGLDDRVELTSRPTNGASKPTLRRAPPAPATTRSAVQA